MQFWLPRLGLIGRLLSSLPHSEEMIELLLPDLFRNSKFRNVHSIGDGRDVMCDV